MPVDTLNRSYEEKAEQWDRCRRVIGGSDRVKDAGEKFLPKLGGQNDEEYLAYKKRAQFYNASRRTKDAFSGLIFRKESDIALPAVMDSWQENITNDGLSLRELAESVVNEVLEVARYGLLIDFPAVQTDVELTQAQAEEMDLRPYIATYPAESIINWREAVVNGKKQLVLVVLKETVDEASDKDPYETDEVTVYRVLELVAGVYRVSRYESREGNEPDLTGEIIPLVNNEPMTEIPFVFVGADGTQADPQAPPLLDLVDVNLAHYLNSASYEHGLHFTGLPTPVITGHDIGEDQSIALGSETALVLSNESANAFYLEFAGAGLAALQTAMTDKKDEMATLGARMLAGETKGVEAAETAAIHRSGEASILASLAGSVSKGLTRTLKIMAEWAGADPEQVEYELNRDFMPAQMDAGSITALMKLWQGGAIAHIDLFDRLKTGEVIAPTREFEDMQEDIENETPTPTMPTAEDFLLEPPSNGEDEGAATEGGDDADGQ